MKHIIKPALSLFIITAIATALLGLARNLTLEPTENQRKKTQERTLKEVLPQASVFSEMLPQHVGVTEGSGNIVRIFEGTSGAETTGYVIELAPLGYSGAIHMMVGISTVQNRITGMRVLKHTETPGLGANAVREKFYKTFDNRRLVPLKVVKITARYDDEIEVITAATITTVAITNAVNEATEWFLNFQNNEGGAK